MPSSGRAGAVAGVPIFGAPAPLAQRCGGTPPRAASSTDRYGPWRRRSLCLADVPIRPTVSAAYAAREERRSLGVLFRAACSTAARPAGGALFTTFVGSGATALVRIDSELGPCARRAAALLARAAREVAGRRLAAGDPQYLSVIGQGGARLTVEQLLPGISLGIWKAGSRWATASRRPLGGAAVCRPLAAARARCRAIVRRGASAADRLWPDAHAQGHQQRRCRRPHSRLLRCRGPRC